MTIRGRRQILATSVKILPREGTRSVSIQLLAARVKILATKGAEKRDNKYTCNEHEDTCQEKGLIIVIRTVLATSAQILAREGARSVSRH